MIYKLPKSLDTIRYLLINDYDHINLVDSEDCSYLTITANDFSFYKSKKDYDAIKTQTITFPFYMFNQPLSLSEKGCFKYEYLYRLPSNVTPFEVLYINGIDMIFISKYYDVQLGIVVSPNNHCGLINLYSIKESLSQPYNFYTGVIE